jgi:trehalose-6-phosphate synthase
MSDREREARMRRMRATVQEHNVYRWAGPLVGELTALRMDA